jgi:microcystin-dependent protein
MLSLTNIYAAVDSAEDTQLATNAIRSSNVGGNLPVNNLQPYLVLNYEIALQGIFPSRS